MVLGLRDSINEMINNVTLVRKQISRLEMKSLGGLALKNPMNEIDSELLLDLDDALAKEGLPIRTRDELNQFEAKLRLDMEYRAKLV